MGRMSILDLGGPRELFLWCSDILVLGLTLYIKACSDQKYRTNRVATKLLSTMSRQQELLR